MMVKDILEKVISGGQTGADLAALIEAKLHKIKTGGTAPKEFTNELGPNKSYGSLFGLVETNSKSYPERTKANIKNSDITIIFFDVESRGSNLTIKLCKELGKEYYLTDSITNDADDIALKISKVLSKNRKKLVLNIAGNRESKSPGIESRVRKKLKNIFNSSVL